MQQERIEMSDEGKLLIKDMTGRQIGEHIECQEKGRMIINNNHYRDHSKTVKDRENEVKEMLSEELAENICKGLKKTNPRIYKDQLVGLSRVCINYPLSETLEVLNYLQNRDGLRVSLIEKFIKARLEGKNIQDEVEYIKLSGYSQFDLPQTKQHPIKSYTKLGGDNL